jgi:DNA-binding Lrp family transcriptional regulator
MADMDYAGDIKKYTAAVNDAAVSGVVKYLGIALRSSKDAALVSCSSKEELERVRDNFMKKKLKMSEPDAELDKILKSVCEQMKAAHDKSRVTFCYLVAEKAGKLGAL